MCVHSEGETRLSFTCNSTPQSKTSLRLPTSDVIDCGVKLHQGFQATPIPVGAKNKNVRSSSVKNIYFWLLILGDEMFTVGKS